MLLNVACVIYPLLLLQRSGSLELATTMLKVLGNQACNLVSDFIAVIMICAVAADQQRTMEYAAKAVAHYEQKLENYAMGRLLLWNMVATAEIAIEGAANAAWWYAMSDEAGIPVYLSWKALTFAFGLLMTSGQPPNYVQRRARTRVMMSKRVSELTATVTKYYKGNNLYDRGKRIEKVGQIIRTETSWLLNVIHAAVHPELGRTREEERESTYRRALEEASKDVTRLIAAED
jgi:hypothetical protein